ncbi:UDP-glucose 4-epimerase [Cellulomonas chitinilytica]|uniref:UDP-glucose 4-epimerase n=1 Tax=Cellulomonas chitinilytica TaxID=398759 RepID=A0A919U0N3_9CELL|nr:NAD-dependent epimerase/dehydratase family protein [Cellulomonas chitinilytica]GIG20601.1 UDP-glucose 4-epimerase [Cellulomonas chitinilytica]
MKVLVTGGAGFVGSHTVEALQRQGDEVLVVDDLSSGDFGWVPDELVVRADVRSPQAARAVEDFRPDAMVLLAAQMSVKVSMRDPLLDADVNVVGLVAMLEAGLRGGCGRFAFASSGGTIYGDVPAAQQPVTEDHPHAPRSFYGITKSVAVSYLETYARERGVETVALALGNVYGPRQNPWGEAGVVAIFAERAVQGLTCTVNGDGLSTRDYVHVDDVADAFARATRRGTGLVNVGTGIGTSVLEIHDHVVRAAGRPDLAPVLGPPLPGEVRAVALDPSRAASELGWRPTVTVADGVPGVVDWVGGRVRAAVPGVR